MQADATFLMRLVTALDTGPDFALMADRTVAHVIHLPSDGLD